MIVTGTLATAQVNLDGQLTVTFLINEKTKALEEIEKIKDVEKLTITAKRYKKSRSLTANGYFWQLADKMAKRLKSDKWTVYLLQLAKYGVFTDVRVVPQAVKDLSKSFRYIEVLHETEMYTDVRCFYGSSTYDTAEMSDLINGTVEDAKTLGIDTMTPDEVKRLISVWQPNSVDSY